MDRRPGGAAGLEQHVGPLGQLVVLDRHAAPHAGVDAVGVRRPASTRPACAAPPPRCTVPRRVPLGPGRPASGAAPSHPRDDPAPEAPRGGRGYSRRMPAPAPRTRARDLGIEIGLLPPGPGNAITDVPGVLVGHATVWREEPDPPEGRGVARTGVTAIVPGPVSEVVRDGRAGRRRRAQRGRRAHLGDPGVGVGRARDADPAHVHDAGGPGLGRHRRAAGRARALRRPGPGDHPDGRRVRRLLAERRPAHPDLDRGRPGGGARRDGRTGGRGSGRRRDGHDLLRVEGRHRHGVARGRGTGDRRRAPPHQLRVRRPAHGGRRARRPHAAPAARALPGRWGCRQLHRHRRHRRAVLPGPAGAARPPGRPRPGPSRLRRPPRERRDLHRVQHGARPMVCVRSTTPR